MPAGSLTDLKVKKLRPTGKRYEEWDSEVSGFGVRVSPQGTKTFVFMYWLHGRKRRVSLGRYPDETLAAARTRAYEMRAQVRRGENPQWTKPKRQGAFDVVLDDFVELHCKRFNKPSTQRSTEKLLRNECLPRWQGQPIKSITRQEINSILDAMVARGSPGAANNAYAAMSKFFNWCVSRDLIEVSPCLGVSRPAKRNARSRVLSDQELKAIRLAAANVGYPFGTIVQLLILTAQRRGEVATLEWDDIDWDDALWSIPGERTKNGHPHTVPLSKPVVEILEATPRLHERFLFPARGSTTTCFSGFGKCKERLDRAVAEAQPDQTVSFDPWCLHDLRRTADTGMASLAVPPHVIERTLNHVSGTFGGVAGVYNRYQYVDEMRNGLDRWAEHVVEL